MKFNLKNTKVLVNEPVPPGLYQLSVVSCKPKVSKAGNPTMEWVFQVETGQDTDEFAGRRIWLNTILSPAEKAWRFLLTLKALGFAEEDLRSEEGFEFEPAEVIGLTLWGQVVIKPGENGNPLNEIVRMFSEAEMNEPLASDEQPTGMELPSWEGASTEDINFDNTAAAESGTAKKTKKAVAA